MPVSARPRRERQLGLPASLVAFLLSSGAIAVLAVALFILFDPRTHAWLGGNAAAAWSAVTAFLAAIAEFFASLFGR